MILGKLAMEKRHQQFHQEGTLKVVAKASLARCVHWFSHGIIAAEVTNSIGGDLFLMM